MSNLERFVGRWKREIFDVVCYYTITISGSEIIVSAYDASDGEEFVISNVKFDNNVLLFETAMPSTGWQVKYQVSLVNRNKARASTTFQTVDRWHKISVCEGTYSGHPLEGTWSGEESDAYDSRCQYIIQILNSRPTVKVHDIVDDEELVVSNVGWDQEYLKFNTLMESSQRVGHHIARSISNEEMELISTFTHIVFWEKSDNG